MNPTQHAPTTRYAPGARSQATGTLGDPNIPQDEFFRPILTPFLGPLVNDSYAPTGVKFAWQGAARGTLKLQSKAKFGPNGPKNQSKVQSKVRCRQTKAKQKRRLKTQSKAKPSKPKQSKVSTSLWSRPYMPFEIRTVHDACYPGGDNENPPFGLLPGANCAQSSAVAQVSFLPISPPSEKKAEGSFSGVPSS